MPKLDKKTLKLIQKGLFKRIQSLEVNGVRPSDLSQVQCLEADAEEALRKLMVVFRQDPQKYRPLIFQHLQLLVEAAKTEDLRFIDAFHFYYEIFFLNKVSWEDPFLSLYLSLLLYHYNQVQVDAHSCVL